MAWYERKYDDEAATGFARGMGGRIKAPPRGALVLMIVHGLLFLLMSGLAAEQGGAEVPLRAMVDAGHHPAGILLHPFATTRLFTLLFVVLALWSLGGRIEQKLGTAALVRLYIAGNLVAGLVFYVLAQLWPPAASTALEYPAGALAALCAAAWRHLRHDAVQVLGKVTTLAKVYAICAAIVVGLELLRAQGACVGWLVAVVAGAGSEPALALLGRRIRGGRRVVRPSIPRAPRKPPPEPEIDDILAKISRSGLESLNEDERARLEQARRMKLRRDL